jgi:hypothetical protein
MMFYFSEYWELSKKFLFGAFFLWNYCAPRGTEPHVALQVWVNTEMGVLLGRIVTMLVSHDKMLSLHDLNCNARSERGDRRGDGWLREVHAFTYEGSSRLDTVWRHWQDARVVDSLHCCFRSCYQA